MRQGTALERALKLLAQKAYSAAELRRKLTTRGFRNVEIESALSVLKRYGYVVETGRDAAELEMMSAEWLRKRAGKVTPGVLRGLEGYLLKKGFDQELVTEHLQKLAAEAGEASEGDQG